MIRHEAGFFHTGFIEFHTQQVTVIPPNATVHLCPEGLPVRADLNRSSRLYFHVYIKAGAGRGIILKNRRFLSPESTSASPVDCNQV